jgi:putative PEP-CTERM system histidine kinase
MADYVIQTIIAAVVLAAIAFAVIPSLRARLRVHFLKFFSRYKYDYRKEWLRFIATLSSGGGEQVHTIAVRAVAQIVNSPGGIVWARTPDEDVYDPVGSWECDIPPRSSVPRSASLIRFLERRQWIVDLNEMKKHPQRYEGLELEPMFDDHHDWWLIVPLFLGERLFGFIVLKKPLITYSLNFEDHDLLKTVGKQVATHIDQAESDRRLSEVSQFTTYNRLTAYLMHDLSNLIAQHSLVVQNAERFRDNPDFVDDAFKTIAHSVSRMERLISQLSQRPKRPSKRVVDIRSVLDTAVSRSLQRQPGPSLDLGEDAVYLRADAEQLTTVIEHLLRNAQESISGNGQVNVTLLADDGVALISIADTGCGMSPEFVRERLFRPFDSTKGSESMGIGAYQAREYVRSLGGRVDVSSEPGRGTTISLSLPIQEPDSPVVP